MELGGQNLIFMATIPKADITASIFIVIINHKNSLFHPIKSCKSFRVKPIFRSDCTRKKVRTFDSYNLEGNIIRLFVNCPFLNYYY